MVEQANLYACIVIGVMWTVIGASILVVSLLLIGNEKVFPHNFPALSICTLANVCEVQFVSIFPLFRRKELVCCGHG